MSVTDSKQGTVAVTPKEPGSSWTFEMPASDVTVQAVLNARTYTVTLPQSTDQGSITADREQAAAGEKVVLTPNPSAEHEPASVTVTDSEGRPVDVQRNEDGTWSFQMPSGGANVSVQFQVIQYAVQAVPVQGGSILPGAERAAKGDTVSFTVQPEAEYTLRSVTVAQADASPVETELQADGSYQFSMPGSDVTITAQFERKTYEVQLPADTPHGSVSAEPIYAVADDTVVLTLTPDEGYAAGPVEVRDQAGETVPVQDNGDGTWSFQMPSGGAQVSASFTAIPYDVRLQTCYGGAASLSAETASVGEEITITAVPGSERTTAQVDAETDAGLPVQVAAGEADTYTFQMPASNVTVTVTFVEDTDSGYHMVVDPATVELDEASLPDGLTAQDLAGLSVTLSEDALRDVRRAMDRDSVDYTGEDWSGEDDLPDMKEDIYLHLLTKIEVTVSEYSLEHGQERMVVDITPYYQVVATDSSRADGGTATKVLSTQAEGADAEGWVKLSLDGDAVPITIPIPAAFAPDGRYLRVEHFHEEALIASFTCRVAGGQIQFTNMRGFSTFVLTLEHKARLNGLDSSAALSPAFQPDTTDYTSSVDSGAGSFTFTPKAEAGLSVSVTVNGSPVEPNPDGSYTVDLQTGSNDIQITVSGDADSGLEPTTYNLQVQRASSSSGGGSHSGGGGSHSGGGGGGGGSSASGNTVNAPKVDNGTYEVSDRKARPGQKVTITPKPADGFDVGRVTVTDRKGNAVEVTAGADGTYTFTMPKNSNLLPVTVDVVFSSKAPVHICPSEKYADVDQSQWYHEAVDFMVERGLMVGVSATSFAPDTVTSRAMVVTILYRMSGSPDVQTEAPFQDVAAGAWYAKPVAWAYANGVVAGYSDDAFGPNDPITRQQMCTILFRYAEHCKYDTVTNLDMDGYVDWGVVDAYAKLPVAWACDRGIVAGTSEATLSPNGYATRSQAAQMLRQFSLNYLSVG